MSVFDHSDPYKRTQAPITCNSVPAACGPSSASLLGPLNLHMYINQTLLPGVLSSNRPFETSGCLEEDELENETSCSQPSMSAYGRLISFYCVLFTGQRILMLFIFSCSHRELRILSLYVWCRIQRLRQRLCLQYSPGQSVWRYRISLWCLSTVHLSRKEEQLQCHLPSCRKIQIHQPPIHLCSKGINSLPHVVWGTLQCPLYNQHTHSALVMRVTSVAELE